MKHNKQSSVEYLMDKLFDPSSMTKEQVEWFEQAKAMHKKEIMRAYNASYNGLGLYSDGDAIAEIYYDQFFKNESL